MTFEDFFLKKKINLTLLQNSDPNLFLEFKNHYAAMGEKSFDHTKKYWFNQLRHRYPTPPEQKADKVVIANLLAEQTIVEALTETAPTPPTGGFKPGFKADMTANPAEEKQADIPAVPVNEVAAPAPPTVGFKPRFKAGMVAKPTEEKPAEPEIKQEEIAIDKPADEPAKPVGFKPRFNAAKMKPKGEE
jgi:hypothetical protein